MAHKGKKHLTILLTATPDLVEEGKKIMASHGSWMAESHHRDGDKALLSYEFSIGPELSNPLDPSSKETGNTLFMLTEVYESAAGIQDHWQQASTNWGDFGRMVEWAKKCSPKTVHGNDITEALW